EVVMDPMSGKKIKATTLKAKAIKEGWNPDQCRLLLLQASYEPGPSIPVVPSYRAGNESLADVLAAGLLFKAGYQAEAEKAFEGRDFLLSQAGQMRKTSIPDLCRIVASHHGLALSGGPEAWIKAAFSTDTMQDALAGGIDKLMGLRFQTQPKS